MVLRRQNIQSEISNFGVEEIPVVILYYIYTTNYYTTNFGYDLLLTVGRLLSL